MPDLFSGLCIGKVKLKNRIALAPIENGYADAGGVITERLIRFYERCAENDCALLFTGSMAVDFDGKGVPSQLEIFDPERLEGIKRLVQRVHAKNAKIAVQLYHAGRQLSVGERFVPIGPSAVGCGIFEGDPPPKEMDVGDMLRIRDKFQTAARRALDCGFDMIELHLAHGYLLHSFLSPYSNKRTDEYGGSIENRIRFPLEILSIIQKESNGRVPIGVRISVEEYLDGGLGFAEAQKMCLILEAHGADFISVSAGSYDSMEYMIQPMFVPRAFLAEYSREIKRHVSVPVIVAGRMDSADAIRNTVRTGDADMVAIGRGFFADPEIAVKIKNEKDSSIRYCTACNQGCLDRIFACKDVRCIFNPQTGYEGLREYAKSGYSKKIGIIGAGFSGITAARYLSMMGHKAILFEKKALGGKLNAMAVPRDRKNFRMPIDEARHMLKENRVELIRREVRNEDELKEYGFDIVLLAAGSTTEPITAEIIPVIEASVALVSTIGFDEIAVIGGGLIGLETARHFAIEKKQVHLFEKSGEIGSGVGATFLPRIKDELKAHGVHVHLGCEVGCEGDVLRTAPGVGVIIQCCRYAENAEMRQAFPDAIPVGSITRPMSLLECGDDVCAAIGRLNKELGQGKRSNANV